jgi:hypothetical protein
MQSKIIKIIILSILAVVLAGGIVFLVYHPQILPQRSPSEAEHYPPYDKALKKAIFEKDASSCDQLKEYSKDQCLFDIATINNDAKFCETIASQEIKNNCQEKVLYTNAVRYNNATGCLPITIADYKNQCLTEIFRSQNDLKYCQPFELDIKNLCEDLININLAYNAKDVKICDKIVNSEYKTDCLNAISTIPQDSDNDGVPDDLERAYGTDPFNAQSK